MVFLSGLARVTIISALNIFYVTAKTKIDKCHHSKAAIKESCVYSSGAIHFLLNLIQPVLFLTVMMVSTGGNIDLKFDLKQRSWYCNGGGLNAELHFY